MGQTYPGAETAIAWSVVKTAAFADIGREDTSRRGINAAVSANANSWLGVTTEGGFNFLSDKNPAFLVPFDVELYTIMAGPKFTLRQADRIAPFFHFLVGVAYSRLQLPGATESSWNLGLQPGGGVDIVLAEPVAVRLGIDWRSVFVDEPLSADGLDDTLNQFRFTLGVTFRSSFR
jgi:opacity protein-like surface antigen